MFKKNNLKKIAVSLVVLLFLAFVGLSFVSAQLTPEIKYPKIGTREITATTSLGEYIGYIFSLGIIIGVLIAIGILIYGGFLFLSSTGKPEQLKEAKDRIFAAFLGLAILLGSYLILATVNPQLTIIKTELVSLNRGVVLTDTTPPPAPPNNIEVTEINVSDVQKIFGDKFEPQKIEIKGKSQGQLKARAFPEPNYRGTPTGWITNASTTTWTIKSLEVRGVGPGIYLHGAQGQELHLVNSLGDFRAIDNFSDKAKRIEIKNLIVGGEKKTDFAAILFTDEYFKNELRIFIEKRNEDRSGKVEPAVNDIIGNVPWDKLNTTSTEAEVDIVPPDNDGYGKVTGVSSAYIFQIGDKENCQEIRLYKAPNFIYTTTTPYCRITSASTSLVYTDRIDHISDIKLPIYKPINIEDACGVEWKDAVQGLELPGKCLVVLFEHSILVGNFPGKNSEVFTANDPDFTDNPIGRCKPLHGIKFWVHQPCTSAIAVYPLP